MQIHSLLYLYLYLFQQPAYLFAMTAICSSILSKVHLTLMHFHRADNSQSIPCTTDCRHSRVYQLSTICNTKRLKLIEQDAPDNAYIQLLAYQNGSGVVISVIPGQSGVKTELYRSSVCTKWTLNPWQAFGDAAKYIFAFDPRAINEFYFRRNAKNALYTL